MANYKETKTSGEVTIWNRAGEIYINNAFGVAPIVTFCEEIVTKFGDDQVMIRKQKNLVKKLSDMSESIQIIDMETGLPKGKTITFKEVYDIVASMYLDLAVKRDVLESKK